MASFSVLPTWKQNSLKGDIASYLQCCEGNISTCLYILSVHNLHVVWNET